MSEIKFYSFALSPFALKVQSYLLYLDIDFDTVFVNPLKIKQIVPCGTTVPAMTIKEECKTDSTKIGLWLDELYPEKQLVPKMSKEKILDADKWVTNRLVNLNFRDFSGFDESIVNRARKRWSASKSVMLTTPDATFAFRILQLLFMGKSFIRSHIDATDKSRSLGDLRYELSIEFEKLLEGGPFLCGSNQPTLADLSAYPNIVKTKVIDGGDFFLPGEAVSDWVARMEKAIPNLHKCFPEILRVLN